MIRWSKARRWLNGWTDRFWPHPLPIRRRTALRVEPLEDRLTPSTFVVTDTNDSATDSGSLRQAVARANADALANDTATITFGAALAGQTISLNSTLALTNTTPGVKIVIDATAASGLTITTADGQFSLFTVNAHVTADFNGLTISQGSSLGNGGGILNAGALTVDNCTLSSNAADNGGGIYNSGTLTIDNSMLSSNTATAQGGAVENHNGTLTIQNSTLSGNTANGGGGADNYRGTLTIQNSDFSTNTASGGGGGGIENNLGTLSLQSSTLDSNATSVGDGGGIFNIGGMTVLCSTLSNNTAAGNGGGIENFISTATVVNTTFSGDSASADGGAVSNDGTLTVHCSTLSGNSATGNGGGIANNGALTLQNSIVSSNTAGVDGEDIDGGITTDLGNNLLGTAVYAGPAPATDVITDNPGLAPLGDYGGAMQTMPVLPGSPAQGTGNAAAAGMPASDENGNARIVAGHVDIGAYQTPANPFLVTTAADTGGVAGQMALREAVSLANLYASTGSNATITFAASLQGATITLTQGDLELSGAPATGQAVISIIGQPGLTIDGGGASSILQIDSGVTAVVTGLTIADGSSAADGGGVEDDGTLTVSNCTFNNNAATGGDGGGINNTGILTVSSSTFINNNAAGNGGGIASSGTLTVQNCTLADNSATDGGAIEDDGTATVQNSTLGDNSATEGGGINNNGTLTVLTSTISSNSASDQGGGIINNQTLTVQNTILSGNFDTAGFPDVEGGITTDLGNNLLGTAVYGGPAPATDVISDNPGLAPLGDYGGAMQTMPLLPGSAGSKAGNASADGLPTIDENGNPRLVAGHLDIGACETPVNPFIVTNTGDVGGITGQMTLREAVNLANAYAGNGSPATITFAASLQGATITLTQGDLELSGAPATGEAIITITGQPGLTLDGGGDSTVLQIDSGVTATVTGLTIADGSSAAGGGILNNGTLTLSGCTLRNNAATAGDGGAIDSTGVLTVSNSTFSGNSATGNGGAIASSGTLTVQNCTLARNSATDGGAIENDGVLTLQDSTVSRNSATSGGGIANTQMLKLQNTILSGNSASSGPDLSGSLTTDQGHNLLGTKVYPGKAKSTDVVTDAPGLAPLGNYGGSVQTMPPLPGSKAHNAGNASAAGRPATDERGFSRTVSGHMDIGAVQTQLQPLMVSTAADPGGQSGALSLREAVNLANAYAAAGSAAVITFAAGLKDDTITLTQGMLEFTGRTATGSATITLNGGRVIELSGNGTNDVLQVDAGVNAVVTGLAVTHGFNAGSGGGIVNNGTLTLQDCTLSGNVAQQNGGAVANTGTLTLQNCTLSGNSATGIGGAISSSGSLTLQSCTLSANSATKGGGISSTGALSLMDSILAANTASSASPDILGTITNDAGYNLLGAALADSTSPSSDIFTDAPGLAVLGSYGGFLQTMALLPGSQALGTGTAHLAPSTDERGTARRKNSRGQPLVDIGAFESAGFTISVVSDSGTQTAKIEGTQTYPLKVSVKAKSAFEPVDGGVITFTAGTSGKGASAILSSAVATITEGVAEVSATGNGIAGTYTVSATTGTASVSFSVRNWA